MCYFDVFFFFFKQKTAYEMRISDWSSDVCSSDLTVFLGSLIFNGKKLKAFNNFLKIKQGLKLKEFFDPYIIFLVSMMKITPDISFLSLKLGGASVDRKSVV